MELAYAQKKLRASEKKHEKISNQLQDPDFCSDAAKRAFLDQELKFPNKLCTSDKALTLQNYGVLGIDGKGGDQDFTLARTYFESACDEASDLATLQKDFSYTQNILGVINEKRTGG